MDRELLAWAAGFIDGEGCFHLRNDKYASLAVTQTELSSLERLRDLFGGSIIEIKPRLRQKDTWQWSIHGFEKVQYVAASIWPWLTVKRPQVERVLIAARSHPPRPKRSNTCRRPDCDRRTYNASLCGIHFEEHQVARGLLCTVEDCDRGAIAHGLCRKHYSKMRSTATQPHPRDRTHCPQGHEYNEANTRIDNRGRRVCRTCAREATRRWEATKSAPMRVL